MKTKKINLNEFKSILSKLVKEEIENNNVKKYKVLNQLKKMGISHQEGNKLIDDNNDIFNQDKPERKIAVELKKKNE